MAKKDVKKNVFERQDGLNELTGLFSPEGFGKVNEGTGSLAENYGVIDLQTTGPRRHWCPFSKTGF